MSVKFCSALHFQNRSNARIRVNYNLSAHIKQVNLLYYQLVVILLHQRTIIAAVTIIDHHKLPLGKKLF